MCDLTNQIGKYFIIINEKIYVYWQFSLRVYSRNLLFNSLFLIFSFIFLQVMETSRTSMFVQAPTQLYFVSQRQTSTVPIVLYGLKKIENCLKWLTGVKPFQMLVLIYLSSQIMHCTSGGWLIRTVESITVKWITREAEAH